MDQNMTPSPSFTSDEPIYKEESLDTEDLSMQILNETEERIQIWLKREKIEIGNPLEKKDAFFNGNKRAVFQGEDQENLTNQEPERRMGSHLLLRRAGSSGLRLLNVKT